MRIYTYSHNVSERGVKIMLYVEEKISVNLRVKRAERQLTLERLSAIIGVSRKTLSLVEKGEKKKLNAKTYQKVVNWLID